MFVSDIRIHHKFLIPFISHSKSLHETNALQKSQCLVILNNYFACNKINLKATHARI